MTPLHAKLFFLAAFFASQSNNTLLAAPLTAIGNSDIISVQVLGSSDFCKDQAQCGNALKITFANGRTRLIRKEDWAAAIWGYLISEDHLSLSWFLADTELDRDGRISRVDAFRSGSLVHSFDCGHFGTSVNSYFAEHGKWLVLSCSDYHQEGYGIRLLMDVVSGRQISQIRSNEHGETPRGAPRWAQHEQ